MKKNIILFLILIVFVLPVNVHAIDYIPKITGSSTIHSKSENESVNQSMKSAININVSNLDNISYMELYVSYDTELVGVSTCNTFNFVATGCSITSDHKIYYYYKDSLYESNGNLFSVTFMYTDKTPSSGTTNINVTFKNARDKNGNSILINQINKTMTFDEPVYRMNNIKKEENNSGYSYNESSSVNTSSYDSETNNSVKKNKKTEPVNTRDIKSTYKQDDANNLSTVNNKKSNNKEVIKNNKKVKSISKQIINILFVVASILLLLGVIMGIISHKKNKKLDKMLDKFDD